ncbi:Poxvirus protein I5 [Isoptericola haloaureus]|uniref:Poxvirus protein I5 n=1 Tax=Isoptericola haloaureus TaxID=1542902 RepID=A0ABU7Z9P9_9MICO
MARRPDARASRSSGRGGPSGFYRSIQLFGEVALVGVLVALGSLLLVTLVPSLAAGVAYLRRDVVGADTRLARYWREWAAATRALWPLGLAVGALAVLLVGDWQLATSGLLPGGEIVALVVALFAAGAIVVVLRATGAWSDDEGEPDPAATTRRALSVGSDRAVEDLSGSALLLGAVVMAAVLVWMLLPLVLVVGGLLVLAVVGVERRRRMPSVR